MRGFRNSFLVRENGQPILVLRSLFRAVDNQDLHWAFGGFQPETQLLPERAEQGRTSRIRDASLFAAVAQRSRRILIGTPVHREIEIPFDAGFVYYRPDLGDTIRRLQAYQEAGADVVYAPGLTSREDIATLVRSVDRPVNVLGGMGAAPLSLDELSALGVKRVSTGGWLARAAQGAFLRAARELRERGTFAFTAEAARSREINPLLDR